MWKAIIRERQTSPVRSAAMPSSLMATKLYSIERLALYDRGPNGTHEFMEVNLFHGDCLLVMRELLAESVDVVVTSRHRQRGSGRAALRRRAVHWNRVG